MHAAPAYYACVKLIVEDQIFFSSVNDLHVNVYAFGIIFIILHFSNVHLTHAMNSILVKCED